MDADDQMLENTLIRGGVYIYTGIPEAWMLTTKCLSPGQGEAKSRTHLVRDKVRGPFLRLCLRKRNGRRQNYIYVYTHTHTHTHSLTHSHTHTHTHTHTQTHKYVYIYVHTYIHICTYI
jgi:hypothetical protein